MIEIRALTKAYATAFNAKDIEQVSAFFAPDFTLTDPAVSKLTGKQLVTKYISEIFDSNPSLSFEPRQIISESDTSVIHFTLTLAEKTFDGVDVIKWQGGNMVSMNAYLTER